MEAKTVERRRKLELTAMAVGLFVEHEHRIFNLQKILKRQTISKFK